MRWRSWTGGSASFLASAWRLVVTSPKPLEILESKAIALLVERGVNVICTGGGGIPVVRKADHSLVGIEAVIDKDLASALLARQLDADMLVMLTDVDSVYEGFGKPGARSIARVAPAGLAPSLFAAGSMGPKLQAASEFASATGRPAAIGRLEDAAAIVKGEKGTRIDPSASAVEYRV